MLERAYFATGCFWGAERRFWNLQGVTDTSVGYMGGTRPNPSYEQVCTGVTGHTETVCVEFDPEVIDYLTLLGEFWSMHDPTSLNSQGNDIGSQYRSAIFFTTPEQENMALATKSIYQKAITPSGYGDIVTEIIPAEQNTYWPAEDYHQKYLAKNPKGYDCHSSTGVAFPLANYVR
jgi:peptide-methionine (S)-S-oxide reductase